MKYIVEFDSDEEMREFLEWREARRRLQEANIPKTPLRETTVSTARRNALMARGIFFLEEAQQLSDLELLRIPQISRAGVEQIRQATRKSDPHHE